MKRLLAWMAAALLLTGAPCARAEDVLAVADAAEAAVMAGDADYVAENLTTSASYLNVSCALPEDGQVTLAVSGPEGVVYQRDYGECSGTFRSEDVYLKLNGSSTLYQVTLQAGSAVYAFPVNRVMARLRDNEACATGYPLSLVSGADTWKSVTILDVQALEGGETTAALHASGAYTLGTATFAVSGGQLTVSCALADGVDGSIDRAAVYVATTAIGARELGSRRFTGITGELDQPIDLAGAPYAAVYVSLRVSFDPSGLPGSPQVTLDGQDALWQTMQTQTANEAVG